MPTRSPARKTRPASKRAKTKRVTAKKATVRKAPKTKIIGRVTHYYDRINVAIIELASPLQVGDAVTFKRGDNVHTQQIGSIQIDHLSVTKAKRGDVVGVKVSREIHEGALVCPA